MREKFINPIFWQIKSKDINPPEFIEFEGQKIDIVVDEFEDNEEYSVVVSDEIDQLKRADSKSTRIFFYQQPLSNLLISQFVNDFQIQGFISNSDSIFKISDLIKSLIKKQKNILNQQSMLKLMQKKNSELEALTQDLEKIVEERTVFIELSHKEEELKLKKERQLIRFIKELADQLSVEDILSYIRKDLRPFHFVGSPLLIIRKSKQLQIYYFGKNQYNKVTHTIEDEFIFNERNLANTLGRPLMHLHRVDFLIQSKSDIINQATLCFEVQQNVTEVQAFFEFLGERIDAMKAALDRVMLEREKETYVQRWTNTFHYLQYPIAIKDHNGIVLRSNQKFLDIKSDLYYEKMQYPFLSNDGEKYIFEIYIDRSEERQLYSRILQNEKLSAIGALAGNLAHELNNPLTGIRSLVQVLQHDSEAGSQIFQDLTEIEKAADRSQKIISNLLDFAQGSSRPENVKVDDLIQKTLSMLKSALRQHRMTISLSANKAFIRIEPQLFQQIIFNLVHNACQAMNNMGDVAIQTYIRGNDVFVEVIDTGPGIQDSLKFKIFEPFYTTKSEGYGTGLGLFLVKQIVEKNNGVIQVKDQNPHGARFVIRFPRVQVNE